MNEPPRSRRPRRRKVFPALLLGGIALLTLLAVWLRADEETAGIRAANPPPRPAAVNGETAASAAHSSSPETKSAPAPSSNIAFRATRLGPDRAWWHSLAPRRLAAKAPPVSPPGRDHRLVVKFADALEARASRTGILTVSADHPAPAQALVTLAANLHLRFQPLQTAPEAALADLRNRAALRSGTQQPDPQSVIEVIPADSSPASVLAAARALLPLAAVEYVEIESRDAPPPPPAADIAPTTPDLVSYQTYRQPQVGIGADFVWENLGIKGHPDLRVTDCEYMFNPQHEDLADLVSLQPGVASMFPAFGDDHGTAALGVLVAGENAYGVSGALQGCQTHFFPEYATMSDGDTQMRTAAITAAIAASAPGDIVLLEMQASASDGSYGPAEYQQSVWDAVKTGTDAGIIIIAAAGNGRENLDSTDWSAYRDRGDSGAIIVGAGTASRSRLSFSTYGRRVDLQGWGSGVTTTGFGTLMTCGDDPNQRYTSTFNGTSSATSIVASAAALLQSVAITKLGTRLSPAEIRSLLVVSGSPQTGYTNNRIGPLPDLSAAVPQLLAAKFSNTDPIAIPDLGNASPFPSIIPVSGIDGIVTAVRVRVDGLSHSDPRNLDLFLVSPSGRVAALMSDAGSSYAITNTSLMFDDSAPTLIPASSAIVPGRYHPGNFGNNTDPLPRDAIGELEASLTALASDTANGDWKLYVSDDHSGDSGSITSWSISFETTPFPTVAFSTESQEVPENSPPLSVTATLSEATTVDVTVPFTVSGSATDPDDFTISASPIVIPAGETSASATITLHPDLLDEPDETIIITMEQPIHALRGAIASQTITILDDAVTLAVASDYGNPVPATPDAVFTTGSEITASVTSPDEQGNIRHLCTGWSGTGSVPSEGTGISATFTIQENSAIAWNWSVEYLLEVAPATGGSVATASGWHPPGAEVPLLAVPANGHHFTGWIIQSGTLAAGSTADPQITLKLDEPASVAATFAIDTFALTYAAGSNGSLSGDPAQLVDFGADGSAVEAIPDPGFQFDSWSDGSPDNPRTDLAITASISVTAAFSAIPPGNIVLETSPDSPLENSAAVGFGSPVAGTSPIPRSFTIRNTGDGPLTGIQLALEGETSAAFTLGTASTAADLAPGASTTFTVSFAPQAAGSFAATLTILSSDPVSNPFQVLLSGSGQTARQAYEDWAASRNPALPPSSVPPGTSLPGLLDYAFGPDGSGLPTLTRDSSAEPPVFRLQYLRRKDSGLTYTALQMADPASGSRSPMAGNQSITDLDGTWERVLNEQAIDPETPRRFFTVEVTLPDP